MRIHGKQAEQSRQQTRWQRFLALSFGETPWQRRHPKTAMAMQWLFACIVTTVVIAVATSALTNCGHKSAPPAKPFPTDQRSAFTPGAPNNGATPHDAPKAQAWNGNATLVSLTDPYYGVKPYCSTLRYFLVPYGYKCSVILQPGTVRHLNAELGVYGTEAKSAVATLAIGACLGMGLAWWSALCGIAAGFAATYAIHQIAIAAWENKCIAFKFEVNLAHVLLPWGSSTASITVYGSGGGYVNVWRPNYPGSKDGEFWPVWVASRDHCSYSSYPPNMV